MRWRPLFLLFALFAGAGLHAEIAGTPAAPRPGPIPTYWLGWGNDALGGNIGDNTDDYRTTALNYGMVLEERWLVAIDASVLTAKQGFAPIEHMDIAILHRPTADPMVSELTKALATMLELEE